MPVVNITGYLRSVTTSHVIYEAVDASHEDYSETAENTS